MSYEPYTWKGGDTVTANKLNHIEQGIAQGGSGGVLYIPNSTMDNQTGIITLGMTAGEIFTALQEGKFVFTSISMEEVESVYIFNLIIAAGLRSPIDYQFVAFIINPSGVGSVSFTCNYEDEYPSGNINGDSSGPGSEAGSGGVK